MASGDVRGFVEIASDEVRHHPARLLGMGLFWAWLQIVFTSPSLTPPTPFIPLVIASSQHQVWIASLFVTLVTFVGILTLRKAIPDAWSSWALYGGHFAMAAGALCLGAAAWGGSMALAWAGVVGTGLGSALAFLAWGDHLARLEPRRVLFDMACYSFLTAIFFGVVMLVPSEAVLAAAVALPVLAGVLLVRANRLTPPA